MSEYKPTVEAPKDDPVELVRYLNNHRTLGREARLRVKNPHLKPRNSDEKLIKQSKTNIDHLLDHWPDGEPRQLGVSLNQFEDEVKQDLDKLPTL